MLIGVSRVASSEFSFLLSIPVMFGMSFFKIMKLGFIFNSSEIVLLIIGMLVAFLISILIIKFLMNYIKKKDFKMFGYYRIILGVILIVYFLLV